MIAIHVIDKEVKIEYTNKSEYTKSQQRKHPDATVVVPGDQR
jgi:hypothetical protein